MFCTEVPGKLILFGEWAVLNGSPCIGLPLDTHFKLEAKDTNDSSSLVSLNNEPQPNNQLNLLKTDPWVESIWETLNKKFPLKKNSKMTTHRAWSLNEGLGSSSAIFLALLRMREFLFSTKLDWDEVLSLFKSIPSNQGSGMDLAIQYSGHAIAYQNFCPKPINIRWPKSLVLLHGHSKMSSAGALRNLKHDAQHLNMIAQSSERFIGSKHQDEDWIQAIEEHFKALEQMGVIPQEALNLLSSEHQKKLGIKTLKSVGAGGMDGLLVWSTSPENIYNNSETLKELGWYLSPHGTLT
jgi:mevalonate kinase